MPYVSRAISMAAYVLYGIERAIFHSTFASSITLILQKYANFFRSVHKIVLT